MRDPDDLFAALARSAFRRRFRLRDREVAALRHHGLTQVLAHAAEIVRTRLAPATIPNDGRQTPTAGHPAFVAQHATATCCRTCLAKWHRLPAGRPLTPAEQSHVVRTIERWLRTQRPDAPDEGAQGQLF